MARAFVTVCVYVRPSSLTHAQTNNHRNNCIYIVYLYLRSPRIGCTTQPPHPFCPNRCINHRHGSCIGCMTKQMQRRRGYVLCQRILHTFECVCEPCEPNRNVLHGIMRALSLHTAAHTECNRYVNMNYETLLCARFVVWFSRFFSCTSHIYITHPHKHHRNI